MTKTENIICQKIMDYFKKNPHAGDTLEGIIDCWVGQKKPGWTLEAAAGALAVLLQKGLIKAVNTQSGTTIYKLKK